MNWKNTRTYKAWKYARRRCNNPKSSAYKWYGGRGIKMCERWSSFKNFLEDMGEAPDGFELDREDNNGDYEPDNCRWISHADNVANSSRRHPVRSLSDSGESVDHFNMKAAAEHTGIYKSRISWAVLKSISIGEPVYHRGYYWSSLK